MDSYASSPHARRPPSATTWRRLGCWLVLVACAWLAIVAPASAQVVQRSFVDQGFEVPYIGTTVRPATGCSRTLPANWVPGWETTENASAPAGFNNGCPTTGTWTGTFPQTSTPQFPVVVGATSNMIQLFRETFDGVNAVEGVQWAELNADSNARIYQSVCMVNGEQVNWSLVHRGRTNTVNPEVMDFNIGTNPSGASSTMIMRGADTITGSPGIPALPGHTRQCGLGTCNTPSTAADGWTTYSGSFAWSGSSGMQTIGFQAIYGSNGTANAGNFLDDIHLALKPYLQFTTTSINYTEGGTAPTVAIQVVGVVPTAFTLTLGVSGTATGGGSDYTLTSATITVPAGDYGLGQNFNVPVTFLDDTVIENNETLILTIPDSTSSSPYVLANTTSCGGAPNKSLTINILDNDVNLRTKKTASTATPLFNTDFTYTVTYENYTGATTAINTTAHNVTTAVSDPVPTGITFNSWTCTATGGAACPAASGSGAISGNAVLPAGGSISYAVTARLAAGNCTATANTSTISVPTGFTEDTSVQAGFSSPAPASPPDSDNTASASVTPSCVDLAITKSNTYTSTQPNDQATDTVTSGANSTYTIVVTNNGPGAVTGAVVKDKATAGLTCPGAGNPTTVACSSSVGTGCAGPYTVAALLGASGITLGTLPPNQTVTLTMTCRVN